jgi:copper homeostasis protein
VVIGATTSAGTLDLPLLRDLADHAAGLALTLHRAVDLVADGPAAVEAAVALGFATILTSGGAAAAIDGTARIAAMRDRAAGRIEILAGSGVTADNAAQILSATGVAAVHASCGRPVAIADARSIAMGFAPLGMKDTDQAAVARLRQALDLYRDTLRP